MKIFLLLILGICINAQIKKIKIIDNRNNPIKQVGIFFKNKRITESDIYGNVEINGAQPQDSIYLIKSGFNNLAFQYKFVGSTIILDSLKTIDIKEVILVKYSAETLLNKVIEECRKGNLYLSPKNFSVFKHLSSKNKIFYHVENNFFWKPKVGRFIENKNNIIKNFESKKKIEGNTDYLTTIFDLNNEKFTLFPFKIPSYGYVTARSIPQLNDIIKDFDKYNFKTEKTEGKIVLSFSPKENTKRVYLGRIIIDAEDFGIYEAIFNLMRSNKNKESTSIDTKQKSKSSFEIESEKFILRNRKENGKYLFDFSIFDLSFKALDGKIKNENFREKNEVKSIDFINVDTSIPFNLVTFEFE